MVTNTKEEESPAVGKRSSKVKAKKSRKSTRDEAVDVVRLRGEVPRHEVYYFAKGNVREGWMLKQGWVVHSWKKRYFILRPPEADDEPSMLYYFERLPFKNGQIQAKGALSMSDVTAVDESELPGRPLSFGLCTDARKFWLQTSTAEEKREWVKSLAAFVLENLSTALSKVDLQSSTSRGDDDGDEGGESGKFDGKEEQERNELDEDGDESDSYRKASVEVEGHVLYVVLKPQSDEEEAAYHMVEQARLTEPSMAHFFCKAPGMALFEGKEYLCVEDPIRGMKQPRVYKVGVGGDRSKASKRRGSGVMKSGSKHTAQKLAQFLSAPAEGGRSGELYHAQADVLLTRLSQLLHWLEHQQMHQISSTLSSFSSTFATSTALIIGRATLFMAYDDADRSGASVVVRLIDLELDAADGHETITSSVRRMRKLVVRQIKQHPDHSI